MALNQQCVAAGSSNGSFYSYAYATGGRHETSPMDLPGVRLASGPGSELDGTVLTNVKDYGASGSLQFTTGIANGTSLTVAGAIDFQPGQGIYLWDNTAYQSLATTTVD